MTTTPMTAERLQEIARLHALTLHEHAPKIGFRMLTVAAVPELLAEVARLRGALDAQCQSYNAALDRQAGEIDRLSRDDARLRDELDHATSHDGDHLSKASRRMVETVMGDRDALRTRVRELEDGLRQACVAYSLMFATWPPDDRRGHEIIVRRLRAIADPRAPKENMTETVRKP